MLRVAATSVDARFGKKSEAACALTAPGHQRLVTHLFRRGDQYLDTDAVFAVKEPLIVRFEGLPPGTAPNGETIDAPYFVVSYDFMLHQRRRKPRRVRPLWRGRSRHLRH